MREAQSLEATPSRAGQSVEAVRTCSPQRKRADERDVRAGGRWTRPQALKNASIRALVMAALMVIDLMPARHLIRCCALLGLLAHAVCARLRVHAMTQVALALPEADPRATVRLSFRTAGTNLGLCLLLRRPSMIPSTVVSFAVEARHVLDTAVAEGRGCVVLSPHLGPYEYTAAVLAQLNYTPAVVVRESYDPKLNRTVDYHRRARGIEVIHRGRPEAPFALLRALRRRRPVGFLPDLPGRTAAVSVQVLGCETRYALGPERVARRTGAAVVMAWLEPVGQNHTCVRSTRPTFQLRMQRLQTGREEGSLLQRAADIASRAIRSSPEQCPWMGMNFHVFSPQGKRTLAGVRELIGECESSRVSS